MKKLITVLLGLVPFGSFSQVSQVASPNQGSAETWTMAVYNGELYFGADDNSGKGAELYKYNGSTISLVAEVDSNGNSNVSNLIEYGGKLFFSARKDKGVELYSYDGNSILLEADIDVGVGSSFPSNFSIYNGELFFQADFNLGFNFFELYKFNGTSFSMVPSFDTSYMEYPTGMIEYNGEMFLGILIDDSLSYNTWSNLYSFNGTSLTKIKDSIFYKHSTFDHQFCVYNNELYFNGMLDTNVGVELYKYDGTNVSLVQDINPGSNWALGWTDFAVLNGEMFFGADKGDGKGQELYKYDGTSITLVADINLSGSSYPLALTEFDGDLYFFADSGGGIFQNLYKLDNSTGQIELVFNKENRIIQKQNLIEVKEFDKNNEFLEVITIDGSMISVSNKGKINLTELSTGVYIVNLKSNDGAMLSYKKVYVN